MKITDPGAAVVTRATQAELTALDALLLAIQIARNQLLTASTRSRESPEVSLDAIAERLQQGLGHTASLGDPQGNTRSLTPEDKLAARQVALGCTQKTLMALAREQRLARARARLDGFAAGTCGQVNRKAACQCEQQLPALAHVRATSPARARALLAIHRHERAEAERQFDALMRMGDAATAFRAHPAYEAPEAIVQSICVVLRAEGYLGDDPQAH